MSRSHAIVGSMAVLLAVCFALTPVQAQDYPFKPIKIIVPTAPAGIGDMLSRIFQQKLAESGNPVTIVVENRAGAAGVIGTDGCTTRMLGAVTPRTTGAKSLIGS